MRNLGLSQAPIGGTTVTKKPAKRRSKAKAEVVDDVLDSPIENQVLDAEVVEDAIEDTSPAAEPIVEDVIAQAAMPEADPVPAPAEPTPEPARGASPLLMLLGGLVAGGIGYGIATYQGGFDDSGLKGTISAQADQLKALQSQIEQLPASVDGVASSVADLTTQTADNFAQVGTDLTVLSERMDVVERQPSADGTLQEAAVAAYQRDIDALRAQIEAQQAEMSEMMTATTAQLAQTREEAVAIEQNAVEKARAATARVALTKVDSAIDSGAPFGAALSDLTDALGIAAPDALVAVSDGVPTLSALQSAFPDAARNALNVARTEGASGEASGGIGSFLRTQLNVRSVTPQEGDSADAILSRAEAALKEGRLADTMAEVAGLPEVARAALTDWSAMAETRSAAQEAVAELNSQIDVN